MRKITKTLYEVSYGIITPIKVNDELVCTIDSIKTVFKRLYPEFTFSIYENENEIADIYVEFGRLWDLFVTINQNNIDRIFEAYSMEYDPLANYDKDSTIVKEIHGSINDNNVKSGSISNAIGSQTNSSINQVSPDSNNTYYESEKTTDSNGSRSDSTTYNNVTDSSTHSFNNYQESTTESTRGNLGVTKSQDMLFDEVGIRNLTYLELFVGRFVKKFCVAPLSKVGE